MGAYVPAAHERTQAVRLVAVLVCVVRPSGHCVVRGVTWGPPGQNEDVPHATHAPVWVAA